MKVPGIFNRQSAILMASLMLAGSLAAQEPQQPPQPQQPQAPPMGEMRQGPGGPERERLRVQVEERFGQMVRTQLNLNDQQMDRLRTAMRAQQDRRRDLMRRQLDVRRSIGQQMQPGVQANNDSLNRLLDQESRIRIEHAQSDEQFMRDLNFLTPVQRARFVMLQQRLDQRMREVRDRRQDGDGPGERPMQPRRPVGEGQRPQGQRPQPQGRRPL